MGKGTAPTIKHEIPRPCRRGNLNCVSRNDAQIPFCITVQMPIGRIMIDPEIRDQPRRPVNRRRQHRTIHPSALAHRRMMIGRAQPGFSLGHDGGALIGDVHSDRLSEKITKIINPSSVLSADKILDPQIAADDTDKEDFIDELAA